MKKSIFKFKAISKKELSNVKGGCPGGGYWSGGLWYDCDCDFLPPPPPHNP